MSYDPLVIALPITDRRASCAFYREALGLEPFGAPAPDGVPEPLQFALNDAAHIMLIPTVGFGWVTGGRAVAPAQQSECLLNVAVATDDAVVAVLDRARGAGATIVAEPEARPWGFTGVFADPDGHLWSVRTREARPWSPVERPQDG